jgi:hypothetical protein
MRVAELAADQIGAIKDAGQRLSFAQAVPDNFHCAPEEELIFQS